MMYTCVGFLADLDRKRDFITTTANSGFVPGYIYCPLHSDLFNSDTYFCFVLGILEVTVSVVNVLTINISN
jgi:hypothetical protein